MEPKKEIEEKFRTEFAASEALKGEFGNDVAAYVAFKKAEAEGRVKRHSGRVKSSVVDTGAADEAGDEDTWKQEFAGSADLQSEYADVATYVAFKKAEAEGRAKLCQDHGVVAFSSDLKTEERASTRAEKICRDEQRQYRSGMPCTP